MTTEALEVMSSALECPCVRVSVYTCEETAGRAMFRGSAKGKIYIHWRKETANIGNVKWGATGT